MEKELDDCLKELRRKGVQVITTDTLVILVGPLSAIIVEEDILDLEYSELIIAIYPEIKVINKEAVKMVLSTKKSVYYNRAIGSWIY